MSDKFFTVDGKFLKIGNKLATSSSEPLTPTIPDYLCFTANTAVSTVEYCASGWPSVYNTAYSRDGITWTSFTPAGTWEPGVNTVTLENVGDKVYFRGDISQNNQNFKLCNKSKRDANAGGPIWFKTTGSLSCSGNIMSIYTTQDFESTMAITIPYCFADTFAMSVITSVPKLPATQLSEGCYSAMFSWCSSLCVSDTQTESAQTPWKIPATGVFTNETAYNQFGMFTGCLGTRSSDDMSGAYGESHTFYTQNPPVQ